MTSLTPPVDDAIPLLPLQQGMALTVSALPHAGVDVQQCLARVREPLDMDRLVRAWQAVMDRHEGLRTHFLVRGVEFFQRVTNDAKVDARLIDWRNLSPAARDDAFEVFLSEDRKQGFDLSKCPVWRVTAFDCAAEGFRFVFSHPHAIVDARSALNILRELFASYASPSAPLRPAGTFRDYMAWHARRDPVTAEARWRQVFGGFESTASVLLPRPADAVSGLATFEHVVDPALGQRIREVAEREKLPLSAVVRAAWAVLLGRLSASNDVVFGEVRSGRRPEVPDMESMVGMFVTTVPIRAAMKRQQTFRALVHQLRDLQNLVRDHEQVAISDIQKWCGLETGTPLFDSAVVFDHMNVQAVLRREGDAWSNREIGYREHTTVPITLNVTALPEFLIKISFERSRFPEPFMQRVPGYFQNLLEAFSEDPDRSVSSMEMLGREERERLLVTWNATAKTLEDPSSLPEAFERMARRYPKRIAVTCDGVSLTYRELEHAVQRLANELHELGVRRTSLVGLCIDRSIGMLIAMLATLKAGAGYVPLDPTFPDERLQFMLSDAKPALIVAGGNHAGRFTATSAKVLQVADQPSPMDEREQAVAATPAEGESGGSQDSVAYVIYTSGSTGRPKGVMVTHLNVLNCFAGMDDVLDLESNPAGMWLAVTSISFDISVIELLWTLTRGYGVTLCRNSADPEEILKLIESNRISHLQCTPSLARMLSNFPGALDRLRGLRALMLGGEALERDLFEALARPIINLYGPTETAIWSTAALVVNGDINIGRPIANTKLYVLDANGAPVPTRVAGELYIGGRGVALGYLNRPELSAERFLADPFADGQSGARMYRTGDLVRYREDSTLEYLERLDSQVKIRGHRIELGEIEAAMRSLPQIDNAVVVARKDRNGEVRLFAYFAPARGCPDVDHEELRRELGRLLPPHEIPAIFVILPSLPLTPNLKIDRKALPDPERVAHLAVARQVVAPRNDIEREMVRLWQEVLTIDPISVTDDFFSLGGDSLRAVQVMLGIRMRLGVEIGPDALHRNPTLAALAQTIADRSVESSEAWATWETLGEVETTVPVIGVHGVDRIFVQFAQHLGLRVDTVTSRVGFDGKLPPYHPAKSVSDMADRYLVAIRERYPHGPYALMGFCLGGLIATEVARRLVDAGERVSFLGLFNSPPPGGREGLRAKLARRRKALASLGVVSHSAHFAADLLRSIFKHIGLAPPRQRLQGIDADDEAARIRQHVIDFGMRMVHEHRCRPFAGSIQLFHGAHWQPDYLNLWRAVARGGAAGFLLPGGHLEMMEEPHVRMVAMQVRESLAAAGVQIATPPDTPKRKAPGSFPPGASYLL